MASQVKQLESRLGLVLFRRYPRRVELTEAGELLERFGVSLL